MIKLKNNNIIMTEYFDAKSARQITDTNRLNSILNQIKDATAQGKNKIVVDYISDSVLENKINDLGYDVYETWENTDPNISEAQFMSLMTNWTLSKKTERRPSHNKKTVIQW
jgi:molybdenum cofactor biosynthesis enzyme MoaA